jgi:hypothetical protein
VAQRRGPLTCDLRSSRCGLMETGLGVSASPLPLSAPLARAAQRSSGLAEAGVNYRAWLGTPFQRGFGFTRSVRIIRPEHIYVGAQPGIVGAGAPVYREDDG